MMSNEIDKLFKLIRRYEVEEIIRFCSFFSYKNIGVAETFDVDDRSSIFPWELDSLLLIKIFCGDAVGNVNELTKRKFIELIEYIREYDLVRKMNETSRDAYDSIYLIANNQFVYQIDYRVLLYRSNFFYTFSSGNLDMEKEFKGRFGVAPKDCHVVLLMIHLLMNAYKNDMGKFQDVFHQLLSNSTVTDVIALFTISVNNLRNLLKEKFDKPELLVFSNFYLKTFCFLENNNDLFITFPHNVMYSMTYGALYRLTENNNELRDLFGKEVLENYIYHLLEISEGFVDIKKEQEYFFRKNRLKTPDVAALTFNQILFVESKSVLR